MNAIRYWVITSITLLGILVLSLYPAGFAAGRYQMDDNAIYHFHRGQAWMEMRHYEAAVREFQIAIKLKPNAAMSSSLYNNLGLAYMGIADYPKAIVSFQKALSLNPNFGLYYQNLANAYAMAGSTDVAIGHLESITSANPGDEQAWYLLGTLYQKAGDAPAAERAFARFRKLSPDSPLNPSVNLGNAQGSQIPSR